MESRAPEASPACAGSDDAGPEPPRETHDPFAQDPRGGGAGAWPDPRGRFPDPRVGALEKNPSPLHTRACSVMVVQAQVHAVSAGSRAAARRGRGPVWPEIPGRAEEPVTTSWEEHAGEALIVPGQAWSRMPAGGFSPGHHCSVCRRIRGRRCGHQRLHRSARCRAGGRRHGGRGGGVSDTRPGR